MDPSPLAILFRDAGWWDFPINLLIYTAPPIAFLVVLVITWLFVSPGGMIIVGWLFESRTVPLWRHQFRAFIPGDFFLGIAFAAMVATGSFPHAITWLDSLFVRIILVVAAIIAVIIWRRMESHNYSKAALNSPTKKFHDIGLFGVYLFFLFSALASAISTMLSYGNLAWPWFVLGTVFALIWIGCVVYDGMRPGDKATYAHKPVYKAFWQHS